mgnify:CR=1 FL=1
MLAIAAPLISLICLIVGMTHQIKIIIDIGNSHGINSEELKEKLEILSVPRILLAIFAGIIWLFYGIELKNNWLTCLNLAGIIMNIALISVIRHLMKKFPAKS